MKLQGQTVGLTTTDGIYIDGQRTVEGDMTGPIAARMVLRDPSVGVAVLETGQAMQAQVEDCLGLRFRQPVLLAMQAERRIETVRTRRHGTGPGEHFRHRTAAPSPAKSNSASGHIRLTSHSGGLDAPPIRWGAPTAAERGPIVGTTTNRSHRNVIGTHSGSYGVYRALAVAAGNLTRGHRADLTNTAPTDVGQYQASASFGSGLPPSAQTSRSIMAWAVSRPGRPSGTWASSS